MTRQPSPRGGHRPRHGRRCRPSSPRLPRERGAGWRKGGCVAPQCPASLATPHHSAPSSSPSGEEDVGQAAAGGSQAGGRGDITTLSCATTLHRGAALRRQPGRPDPPCRRRREGERNEWTDFRGED
jgi:hypothetical protein